MSGWAIQKTFGSRVREKLAMRKWSVNHLATLVNCSPGYLYRIVRGEQEPSWSLAVNIGKALGVFVDELADDWGMNAEHCPYCGRQW